MYQLESKCTRFEINDYTFVLRKDCKDISTCKKNKGKIHYKNDN